MIINNSIASIVNTPNNLNYKDPIGSAQSKGRGSDGQDTLWRCQNQQHYFKKGEV